jgi:putative heme transporter
VTIVFSRHRATLIWTAVVVVLCALAITGVIERSRVEAGWGVAERLQWWWVACAVGAESASMASLARSQRQLLRVGGKDLSLRSAVAVTYAGNAMSVSLPFVGAGVGTAFTFNHWRRRGLDSAAIGWALTVSGIMSTLSFALLMTVGAAVSGNRAALIIGLSGAAVSALPALALLAGVRVPAVRRVLVALADKVLRVSRRVTGRPKSDLVESLEGLLDKAGSLHATQRQYAIAFALSLRNWGADCLCLVASIKAAGAHVPWHGILLVYCLAVTAGSTGITPGGLGVIEVTMTAGLVGAGLTAKSALVGVLVYRAVSFWLVVAVGWVVAARLAKRPEVVLEAEAEVAGFADDRAAPSSTVARRSATR